MGKGIKDLKKTKGNPRIINDEQLEKLNDRLAEFGDLSGVVYNMQLNELVGGNQRTTLFSLKNAQIEYIKQFDEPTKDGSTAFGFITIDDQRFNYREVKWNKKKHKRAVLIANTNAGDWDLEALQSDDWSDINFELDIDFSGDENLEDSREGDNTKGTGSQEVNESENPYSVKIDAPIYEPKNEKPQIDELFNNERHNQLIQEIEKSEISKEEKEFLKIAAQRHIVFNYEKIADFYAHSSKEAQNLMENSALVIIDFNKAIELGYVRLGEGIAKQYLQDYPNTEEDEE